MTTESGAWMPMYWGDYFGDTMHLTTEEHGAYFLLIGNYWARGSPLPDDDARLARLTRMTTRKWKKIRPTMAEFFEISEDGWAHKISERWAYFRARRKQLSVQVREEIWLESEGKCFYCGKEIVRSKENKPDQFTIDHIIPLVKGGGDQRFNLVSACRSCNSRKRAN